MNQPIVGTESLPSHDSNPHLPLAVAPPAGSSTEPDATTPAIGNPHPPETGYAPSTPSAPLLPEVQNSAGIAVHGVPLQSPPPDVARSAGETPRAYNAFVTFLQLGHTRTHQAVADKLGETLGTIKNWSSKFDWSDRVKSFYAGLLQEHASAEVARAADWARRLDHFREQEWEAAQKLRVAAQCFLESLGDEELHRMTLAQASRALNIASHLGRSAIHGADLPPATGPVLSPIQQHLLEALNRAYPQPASSEPQPNP